MRVVLLAFAVLAMILGPLAGPGAAGRAAAAAVGAQCHHGGAEHHHPATTPVAADEADLVPCADDRAACPGAIHCVSLACFVAALPAGAAWPPIPPSGASGPGVESAVDAAVVAPPFEPPRT